MGPLMKVAGRSCRVVVGCKVRQAVVVAALGVVLVGSRKRVSPW